VITFFLGFLRDNTFTIAQVVHLVIIFFLSCVLSIGPCMFISMNKLLVMWFLLYVSMDIFLLCMSNTLLPLCDHYFPMPSMDMIYSDSIMYCSLISGVAPINSHGWSLVTSTSLWSLSLPFYWLDSSVAWLVSNEPLTCEHPS